ncbi:MAG TPA: peptidylprolyl isomerase [Patescibacteria group bacterium]|nr:peptidylprolyl isomerase [Patescibacteria group bacterium]
MTKTAWIITSLILVAVLTGSYFWLSKPAPDTIQSLPNPTPMLDPTPQPTSGPPAMQIDAQKSYTAVLQTSTGPIIISLNAKDTPITVNNFISLARKNFYDKTIFHRVIKGFMIQGGDPNGDGSGGPGYKFADEPITGEYSRGTVAMANSGPNTNGSQFFIMHADYPLPKNYVIFGKVTAGLEVVDKIATAEVSANRFGENSQPVSPVSITSVQINEEKI